MSRNAAVLTMAGGALVALALSIWVYVTPLTGATGAPAPLLTGFGSLAILVATFLLLPRTHGGFRVLLIVLTALALFLTAFAGAMMLHPEISVAMAVAAAGMIWLLADQQMHRQGARS
ncbi:hypothetical protein [Pseudoroseicyclus sp. CXY001]|uniref:hypothetical protein n=1 Tax=Pseudoroseicyclus sp. CXY001 TaxID=3242492 RepID=UPI003570A254